MYSCKDAAEQLGIPERTVRGRAKQNSIGQIIGKTWAFTSRDLEKLKDTPRPGNQSGRPRTKKNPS
jgi:hypothetical protein